MKYAMMMTVVWLLIGCSGDGGAVGRVEANPDWEEIKRHAKPFVALPEEFGTPSPLPLAVGGWEDGLYISRDGLNLYGIYLPVDMFSFFFLGDGDISNFSAYRRGPTLGMDLQSNPIGASEWLHGDIVYSRRENVDDPFPAWQLSNLARPVWSEGAVQIVLENPSTADIFAYTSNHNSNGDADNVDILVFRHSPLNPSGVGYPLPPPVTSPYREDNPHFERLESGELILFFDSDRAGGEGDLNIWFSTSFDDGESWLEPQLVSTLDAELEQQMPHLYQEDSGEWFVYYMNENPETRKHEIWRAKLSSPGDWDSWTDHELVIGVGNTFAVGEPTLTADGDLYFVVVYDAGEEATETDRFDADPWFLPRKNQGKLVKLK